MVKGGNEKSEDSTKRKADIIEKGIVKKNVKGKKLEGVVEAASGSSARKTGISGSTDEFAGYIFLCNGRTKPECFSYRVFGLPSFRIDIVAKIKPKTKLFLFDFDVKLLYGVYSATSTGTMNLEPDAFGGKFPAQVRFEIFKECTPIPESKFKNVIRDNYQGSKFRQDLSANQVDGLISLFRPLTPPPSASPTTLRANETPSRQILLQEIEKQNHAPTSLLLNEIQSREILRQEIEKQSRVPLSFLSNEIQSREILHQEIEKQSRAPVFLLSNELLSREILHQEIEKQTRSPNIYALSQQAPGSQYIGSRFGQSLYKALPLSLYDSKRSLASMSWAHEITSDPSQLCPLSRLLTLDNAYRPELSQHPHYAEYPASDPRLHGLSSGHTNGRVLSGLEVNNRMGLPDDYYVYHNQNSGRSHALQQIPQQVSAPYSEPNKAPSSVLAAAYWAAVAKEIPQPGVRQTSDSGNSEAGHNSNSLQYKPPNITSRSLLDAYWEAKALEDSRNVHPGSSHFLLHSSQQPMSASQGSMFPVSYPYADQNQNQLHPNQLPAPSSQGGEVLASSNSQVATYASGIQHQALYNPPEVQQQVVYNPAEVQHQVHYNHAEVQQQVLYNPAEVQQQVIYNPAETQMQHGPAYYSTYTL